MAWPQWRTAPQLQGWFPAVLALAALPWPTGKANPQEPDARPIRRELGTAVLGALWRHLDPTAPGEPGTGPADPQQPPDPTELARQVAAAITAQAPTDPDHPGRYLGVGPSLTAALALAFLDQTLHTATTHTPHLTATIGTAHQAAARRVHLPAPPQQARTHIAAGVDRSTEQIRHHRHQHPRRPAGLDPPTARTPHRTTAPQLPDTGCDRGIRRVDRRDCHRRTTPSPPGRRGHRPHADQPVTTGRENAPERPPATQ